MMRQPVLAMAISAALLAQNPPAEQPEASEPIRTVVTVVVAPTTVLNKDGNYVTGLQPQDFTLYDNGKPQRIAADVSYEPISMVLAIQASNMLNDILPKVQKIGNEVTDLVVGSGGELAVVAFDHRIRTVQDFTDDGAKVSEALKRITAGSSTHALNDTVVESVRMLRRRPQSRRRVLVLISEKRDRGSSGSLRDALTEAEFANVAIYSLDVSHLQALATGKAIPPRPDPIPPTAQHLPASGPMTPTQQEQLRYNGNYIPMFVEIFRSVKSVFVDDPLDIYTRFTGGKEYSFLSQKSLEKAVSALGQEIHNQYLLSYTPNNLSEGGFHEIRVIVNRPGLEVRTRPGYWVAARPEAQ